MATNRMSAMGDLSLCGRDATDEEIEQALLVQRIVHGRRKGLHTALAPLLRILTRR